MILQLCTHWRSEPRRCHCLDSTYILVTWRIPANLHEIINYWHLSRMSLFAAFCASEQSPPVMGHGSYFFLSRSNRTHCMQRVCLGWGRPSIFHTLRSFRSVPQWTCWGNCTRGVQRVYLRRLVPSIVFYLFFRAGVYVLGWLSG